MPRQIPVIHMSSHNDSRRTYCCSKRTIKFWVILGLAAHTNPSPLASEFHWCSGYAFFRAWKRPIFFTCQQGPRAAIWRKEILRQSCSDLTFNLRPWVSKKALSSDGWHSLARGIVANRHGSQLCDEYTPITRAEGELLYFVLSSADAPCLAREGVVILYQSSIVFSPNFSPT